MGLPAHWQVYTCQILYPVLMLDQHSHFKRLISRLSPGFIKTIHCTSQYNCARMKLDLCNKPEEVCSQLCSCGSSERFEIRSRACSKPQSFVLLKSDKSPHSRYTISTLTTNLTEAFIVSEVQSALLSMSTPFLPPNSRQLRSPGRPN